MNKQAKQAQRKEEITRTMNPICGIVWDIGATCGQCATITDRERAKTTNALVFHSWDMESHYAAITCDRCGHTFGEATGTAS